MSYKAILISRATSSEGISAVQAKLAKLREFAQNNEWGVIQELSGIEEGKLHESQLFSLALDIIEKQEAKVAVVLYNDFYCDPSDIENKYKRLIKEEKIQLFNYCHPCFTEPTNDSIKTWRYLTLPKFVDILQNRVLHFATADRLRADDKTEGATLTAASLEAIKQIQTLSQKNIALPHPTIANFTINQVAESEFRFYQANENGRLKEYHINCWHMNDHENFAMWKVYSEPFGVCIQSTYKNLARSFADEEYSFFRNKNIYIGEVKYIDWDSDVIPGNNVFWPVMHKKREFAYENELRCIIWEREKSVVRPKVNLDTLIEKVYINPYTPTWFHDVLSGLCEKYGVAAEKIIQSKLT